MKINLLKNNTLISCNNLKYKLIISLLAINISINNCNIFNNKNSVNKINTNLLINKQNIDKNNNKCSLKIAKTEKDLYSNNNYIYDSGTINPNWSLNSKNSYVSETYNNIDYFYLIEINSENSSDDTINIEILSDNKDIVESSTVTKNKIDKEADLAEKLSSTIVYKSFEILYNCKDYKDNHITRYNKSIISLSISSTNCNQFQISWIKMCPNNYYKLDSSSSTSIVTTNNINNLDNRLSNLNINLDGNNNLLIVKNGIINKNIFDKILIQSKQSTIKLGMFSSSPNHKLEISQPLLSFDENVLEAIATNDLKLGGDIITDNVKYLNVVFICKPNKKEVSDFQLVIKQQNFEIADNSKEFAITLNFKKECNTLAAIEQYFSFLNFIYWVMMLFVLIFAITTIFYFLNRNGMTLDELLKNALFYIHKKIIIFKENMRNGIFSFNSKDNSLEKYCFKEFNKNNFFNDNTYSNLDKDEDYKDNISMTTKKNEYNTYGGI